MSLQRKKTENVTRSSTPYCSEPNSDNTNVFLNDPDFTTLVQKIETAIKKGIDPELIRQGSSGSYFAYSEEKEIVAVFKPKDEEPFAAQNPKWKKWLHRHFSPCCFGRSCLIPNFGYLSEAAASVVDEWLDLGVVPKTRVVRLASKSFSYRKHDRNREKLPPKIGSLQLFVKDFKDAGYWLRLWESKDPLKPELEKAFLIMFQKMVVLDYVIRNTDRSHDNWMIKYNVEVTGQDVKTPLTPPTKVTSQESDSETTSDGSLVSVTGSDSQSPRSAQLLATGTGGKAGVEIAVIDNGLAFPHKHPDAWRLYPFYWTTLRYSKEPFCQELTSLIGNKLDNPRFVEALCDELNKLFMIDANFERSLCWGQMAVLRGQVANLRRAFSRKMCPAELVQLPTSVVYVRQIKSKKDSAGVKRKRVPTSTSDHHTRTRSSVAEIEEGATWEEVYREKIVTKYASFTCC